MGTSTNSPLVPTVDVIINGTPVSASALRYVEDVVVDDSVEFPSMFAFAMTSSDAQGMSAPWIDDALFSVGNVVELKMGEAQSTTTMIIGEITALQAEYTASRLPLLRVEGYDRRHRLQRGRKTRTFLQKKDSDIASQIGGEAGLSVTATDTSSILDYVLQANQTDWEFLCDRARLIRYEVVVQDKTLFFRPTGNDQSEILTLSTDNDLMEFYLRLSSSGQASTVRLQGWDVKNKAALKGESRVGAEVSTMGGQSSGGQLVQAAFGDAIDVVTDQPVAAQDEADQIALARYNELVLELITGDAICRGRTDLRAGKVIKIDGIGKRFSGQYYVTSAIHRYSTESGYVTEIMVRRNAS